MTELETKWSITSKLNLVCWDINMAWNNKQIRKVLWDLGFGLSYALWGDQLNNDNKIVFECKSIRVNVSSEESFQTFKERRWEKNKR